MFKAVKYYSNTYYSTKKTTPLEVQEQKVDFNIIKNRLEEKKQTIINKCNKNRENYEENREEGFIKNYRSVRHKDEPKFRKHKLTNVHENNIKRPFKFSGENAITLDNDSSTSHQSTNSND